MPNEDSLDDLQALWQSQPAESLRMQPAELHRKMKGLRRTVLWRNIREYSAAALVVLIFGYYTWRFPTILPRIGSSLIVAGTIFVVWHLHRMGSARLAPSNMAPSTCLDFYRMELERQRDLLRGVWSSYLLPFVPGMIIFLVGIFRFAMTTAESAGRHVPLGRALLFFSGPVACVALIFFAVWKLNQWGAAKLQAQIDALDALKGELE